MKRFFFSLMALVLAVSIVDASGNKKGGSSSSSTPHVTSGTQLVARNVTTTTTHAQTLSLNKVHSNTLSSPKNLQLHTQFCSRFNVPLHLHSSCCFYQNFCYTQTCYFPRYSCCGYWNSGCWYYWYEPFCCYLPYSCIDQYAPVALVPQVNIVNTNTNVNQAGVPMLPAGATSNIPAGVNPVIPAPKQ